MKKILTGLIAGLGVAALAAAPAHAVNVTVRVEGKTANVVPATVVTLPTSDVLKDGSHPCAQDSFGGALQSAVGDDWQATYYASYNAYTLDGVKGYMPQYPDYFALWINHRYSDKAVCDPSLQEGDEVLALVDYCTYDSTTQSCTNDSVLPLALDVPRTVTPGTPFTVTVTRYAKDGTSAPVSGASVGGQTTDAAGHATLTVSAPGPASFRASKPNFAGVDASTCATNGSDGYCGTSVPSGGSTTTTTTAAPCVHDGDDGRCGTPDHTAALGQIQSVREGQRFGRGKGPRTLAGVVNADPSGLKDVALRLTRTDRHRCTTFSDRRERFSRMRRCGATHGHWFSVGDRQAWSYLLPGRLRRGRYVLDVRTVDNAGNVDDTLQRTRNRIVFRVS